MQKSSDFHANYELYYELLLRFKSDAKNSDFHANYELYKEFLLRFKSDAKYSDFHANQSNLLMGGGAKIPILKRHSQAWT